MAYSRPGIYVTESLLKEQPAISPTTAVAAFVAPARRGSTSPMYVTGWTEFTRAFGPFTGVRAHDVLHQAVYDYFTNGGRAVVVARTVGAGATRSSADLLLVGADEGTPGDPGLSVQAADPGEWGDQLRVEVLPGSDDSRFHLIIRLLPQGTTTITNQQIVERWSDMSLNPLDGRWAVGILNNAGTGSAWLNLKMPDDFVYTDGMTLASSTEPGGLALTGGDDGAEVTDEDYLDTVYRFDDLSVPFVLNLPGQTRASLITALADYADSTRLRQDNGEPGRGDVFVVVDSPEGANVDDVVTLADTYPNSDHLAVYYPRLVVADPVALVPGATKLVPAGPSVCGRYIATDAARGPWKAPAGTVDGLLAGVVALEAGLRNPQLDRLNDQNVNAIRGIPGRGPCIFGARTRRRDYVTRYVSARRTIINVRSDLVQSLAFAPFENNDAVLWASMKVEAERVLRTVFGGGGLKGTTPDEAYYVKCDRENNTTATVAAGEVHMEVGLALQRPAEFVVLTLSQFEGGTSVNEGDPSRLRIGDQF